MAVVKCALLFPNPFTKGQGLNPDSQAVSKGRLPLSTCLHMVFQLRPRATRRLNKFSARIHKLATTGQPPASSGLEACGWDVIRRSSASEVPHHHVAVNRAHQFLSIYRNAYYRNLVPQHTEVAEGPGAIAPDGRQQAGPESGPIGVPAPPPRCAPPKTPWRRPIYVVHVGVSDGQKQKQKQIKAVCA